MKAFLSLLSVAFAITIGVAQDKKDEKKDDKKFDAKTLDGAWSVESGVKMGNKSGDEVKKMEISFKDSTMKMKTPDGEFVFKMKFNADKTPLEVDIEIADGPIGKGSTTKGIAELKGEELKLCYEPTGMGDRPTKFDGEKAHYFVFKKKKADK
jgi:uncharacterized protein (TIGR03067 family)